MTNATQDSAGSVSGAVSALRNLYTNFFDAISMQPIKDLSLLISRIGIGLVFWLSGRTKVENGSWNPLDINDKQETLFGRIYGFGDNWEIMAQLASLGEHVLPILLFFGVLTRFGAMGLLVMTAVIQLTFPSAWNVHLVWAGVLLVIATTGPGRISVDHFVGPMLRK